MAAEEKFLEQFRKEINKSIILEEEDKKYWLENSKTLPKPVVESFYTTLKNQNAKVEKYIKRALKEDPGLAMALEGKVNKLKKIVIELKEVEEKGAMPVEEFLEKELKKI